MSMFDHHRGGGIDSEGDRDLIRRTLAEVLKLSDTVERLATAIVGELRGLNHRQGALMAAIDDLKTAISNEDAEIDAIVAYVADLGQQLAAALANDDTAALQALSDDVNTHAAELQAAIPAATASTSADAATTSEAPVPTVPDNGNVPVTDPLA